MTSNANEPNAPASDAASGEAFDTGAPDRVVGEHELVLNLEGYEGPLDVLLGLAREQKVDLRTISMVALVDQYLDFITRARRLRLEIAADYLVMAAWLAYLKSRLLLPEEPQADEPSAAEMADALNWQLRRLEAMQEAGTRLMARAQLGRDIFRRGAPEGVPIVRRPIWQVTLYDLLKAYGDQHKRAVASVMHIKPMEFFSVEEAVERLSRLLGLAIEWRTLLEFLPPGLHDALKLRSAVASTFTASLHLAKEGKIELQQNANFGPIMIRKRDPS